ncbi:hypothetical protein [Micromonospora sp. CB01531]|uniref:hypothetical protein n=1 Tax=Micromonospora sp. CB01531 TaxID=1718947 RepID=UPI00093EC7EB|nr:hypothetical protein A6A27_25485 [Micromonospora sp. CB01531]
MQVIWAVRQEWIFPFTGLTPAQFRRLVRLVAKRGSHSRHARITHRDGEPAFIAARRVNGVDSP